MPGDDQKRSGDQQRLGDDPSGDLTDRPRVERSKAKGMEYGRLLVRLACQHAHQRCHLQGDDAEGQGADCDQAGQANRCQQKVEDVDIGQNLIARDGKKPSERNRHERCQ